MHISDFRVNGLEYLWVLESQEYLYGRCFEHIQYVLREYSDEDPRLVLRRVSTVLEDASIARNPALGRPRIDLQSEAILGPEAPCLGASAFIGPQKEALLDRLPSNVDSVGLVKLQGSPASAAGQDPRNE